MAAKPAKPQIPSEFVHLATADESIYIRPSEVIAYTEEDGDVFIYTTAGTVHKLTNCTTQRVNRAFNAYVRRIARYNAAKSGETSV